jgi:hypothetical protein
MTHSWCRDVQRDEAVRAAEGGREGPLPTLEEAISGVTNRRPVDAGGGGNVTPAASGAAVTDVAEIARLAFDAGWGSSRDGFNAECAFDHLAPKESTFEGKGGEPYEKLKRESVAKIMSEAASGAAGTGWLTAEEREAVTLAAQQAPECDFVTTVEGKWINKTLTDLLARSSPPEVVRPGPWKDAGGPGHPQVSWQPFLDTVTGRRDAEWLAAIADAGVPVKEVGRE